MPHNIEAGFYMGPVESNETFPSAFIIKIHSHCIIFWFLYTLSLFDDFGDGAAETEKKQQDMKREQSMQKAMIELKKKFGKNAVLKGMNLEEGGTTIERNGQIGGHKA